MAEGGPKNRPKQVSPVRVAPERAPEAEDKAPKAEIEGQVTTDLETANPEDKKEVSDEVSAALIKRNIGEMIDIEDPEDKLAETEINFGRFDKVLRQIKEINKDLGDKDLVAFYVEGDKLAIRSRKIQLTVDLGGQDFESALFRAVKLVINEYNQKAKEESSDNEYTRMLANLKDKNDPLSTVVKFFVSLAAQNPQLADMFFYGGFHEKIASGSYAAEQFGESERKALAAEFKEKTDEEKAQLTNEVIATSNPVKASIKYLARVLWDSSAFDSRGPASLAAALSNASGEDEEGQTQPYYTQYVGENIQSFVKSPKENSVVLFKYGDDVSNIGGKAEKFLTISSMFSGDRSALQEGPKIYAGYITTVGQTRMLEFFDGEEGLKKTIPLDDKSLAIMAAYAPTATLEAKRRPQAEIEEEKKKADLKAKKESAEKKLKEQEAKIKELEAALAEAKELAELREKIDEAKKEEENLGALGKNLLQRNEARFKVLFDKHPDYADSPQEYAVKKETELQEAQKLLEDELKPAAKEAKEAYERATKTS